MSIYEGKDKSYLNGSCNLRQYRARVTLLPNGRRLSSRMMLLWQLAPAYRMLPISHSTSNILYFKCYTDVLRLPHTFKTTFVVSICMLTLLSQTLQTMNLLKIIVLFWEPDTAFRSIIPAHSLSNSLWEWCSQHWIRIQVLVL